MIHVTNIFKDKIMASNDYPFSLPLFQNFKKLIFTSEVTIIVGDNGSGKTTFFNILANVLRLNRIDFPNSSLSSKLTKINDASESFKVSYRLAQSKGFFFQGEEFIQYLQYLNTTILSCQEELKRIDIEYKDKSVFARNQARMPYMSTLSDLKQLYDTSLLELSHGEGFIAFFKSRLKPNQIYLLDEPETPLSFQNLLVMIALIKDAIKDNSQFIISTHSPVLAAFPNATIYSIEDYEFVRKEYDEIEAISSLKYFLNHKEAYLNRL